MKLLLDTHVLLWALADQPRLEDQVRAAIVDGSNAVFASAASAWEIAVKKRLGKLEAPDDLPEQLAQHRFAELPVTVRHALRVEHLPDHHRDPFDRLLVAQALSDRLTIVTADSAIAAYEVDVLLT